MGRDAICTGSVSYAIAWASSGHRRTCAPRQGIRAVALPGHLCHSSGGMAWWQFAGVRIQSRRQSSQGKGQAAACTPRAAAQAAS